MASLSTRPAPTGSSGRRLLVSYQVRVVPRRHACGRCAVVIHRQAHQPSAAAGLHSFVRLRPIGDGRQVARRTLHLLVTTCTWTRAVGPRRQCIGGPDGHSGTVIGRAGAAPADELPGLLQGPLSAELVAGGPSNLTYVLTDGVTRWVLRRPPLGAAADPRSIDAQRGGDVVSQRLLHGRSRQPSRAPRPGLQERRVVHARAPLAGNQLGRPARTPTRPLVTMKSYKGSPRVAVALGAGY
jgi:hypothetical protein